MRVWPMLLAIVPLMPTDDIGLRRAAPCPIAIAIDVRANLAWGSVEWHVVTSDVDRSWAPYGVTFCWLEGSDGCEGLQVRVRVLIVDELPRLGTNAQPAGRPHFLSRQCTAARLRHVDVSTRDSRH